MQSQQHLQAFLFKRLLWITTVLLTLTCKIHGFYVDGKGTKNGIDIKIGELKRNKDGFYEARMRDEDAVIMHEKWFETGLSSLFSALANKRLKKQRRAITLQFGQCSRKAYDITQQAKCLSRLINNRFTESLKVSNASQIYHYGIKHNRPDRLDKLRNRNPATDKYQVHFKTARRKRSIAKTASSYNIMSNKPQLTPMGHIARLIIEGIKADKGMEKLPKWKETVEKFRRSGSELRKRKKQLEDRSEESLDMIGLRAAQRQANLFEQRDQVSSQKELLFKELEELDTGTSGSLDPTSLKRILNFGKKLLKKGTADKVMDLIKQGVKLGYRLAGQNVPDIDSRSLRMASPRFLGLVPEKNNTDEISIISPSLFSLHGESSDPIANLTSIPSLLHRLDLKENELWLDIIMELSGANSHAEMLAMALENDDGQSDNAERQQQNMFGMSTKMKDDQGRPIYATKENATQLGADPKILQIWERLHSSYTKDQLHGLNNTGYAVLNHDQIELMYGPASPLNHSATHERLMRLNESEVHTQVERDIERIAHMEKFSLRQADIVLSWVSFFPAVLVPGITSQPFILSPVIFTPIILSPSIFGAIVVTPWMFVPYVLSPRVLGGLIVSPFMFSPIILTPLAMHPNVLAPGIFNPFVLSAAVLSPLIISPQVFTPFILSPLCMCPLILSPVVGSPLVLSPFVLNPVIISPHAFGGLVMSPYLLSPIVLSPLYQFSTILSPSFLS